MEIMTAVGFIGIGIIIYALINELILQPRREKTIVARNKALFDRWYETNIMSRNQPTRRSTDPEGENHISERKN